MENIKTLAIFEKKFEASFIQIILTKKEHHYRVSKFVDHEKASEDVFNHYTEASRSMVELIKESMQEKDI